MLKLACWLVTGAAALGAFGESIYWAALGNWPPATWYLLFALVCSKIFKYCMELK